MRGRYKEDECVICGKTFMKSFRTKTTGRRPVGLRGSNTVTCSKECASENRRMAHYDKCKCGEIKHASSLFCRKCHFSNLREKREKE